MSSPRLPRRFYPGSSATPPHAGHDPRAANISLLPRHPVSSSSSASTARSYQALSTFARAAFSAPTSQQRPKPQGPHTYMQQPFVFPGSGSFTEPSHTYVQRSFVFHGAGTFTRPYFSTNTWSCVYYLLIVQGDCRSFRWD
jgi:hypothetical protein